MTTFTLGQQIRISGTADKVRDRITWRPANSAHIYTEAQAAWDQIKSEPGRTEYGLLRTRLVELEAPAETGVIVGWRTIQQGVTEYYHYGDPPCFLPCESTQVWLVAFHLRRKPVMCFDHQVEAI
ncbi:hypothetical protein [Citricoccus sp. NR2]|uniref:hypothetical protein n=1 Tax=Citricoccus sp. NR2 TaxID=3004095 RepID=UPI0022DD12B4|nr:hypothetical protein [Citricoccus sp. NR2]WBL18487.1 hypothetical protein O1A05_12065 [Citricoccus sp. NR2]